jgi:hypothetical protein
MLEGLIAFAMALAFIHAIHLIPALVASQLLGLK